MKHGFILGIASILSLAIGLLCEDLFISKTSTALSIVLAAYALNDSKSNQKILKK